MPGVSASGLLGNRWPTKLVAIFLCWVAKLNNSSKPSEICRGNISIMIQLQMISFSYNQTLQYLLYIYICTPWAMRIGMTLQLLVWGTISSWCIKFWRVCNIRWGNSKVAKVKGFEGRIQAFRFSRVESRWDLQETTSTVGVKPSWEYTAVRNFVHLWSMTSINIIVCW